MIEVNPNNGNETKPDIFSWQIFPSDNIFQWSQNTKIFQTLLKLGSFKFIAKLSTNNYNDIKSNGTCADLICFLI